ncbi:unnamed protein product [Rodentolepis nana]|uniref:Uncharacterized protein n=1 Tax=Rodentolepis nana TaxID=102285 RepID=A0A3P7V5Q8_RODNA|nr:unnamed protein product [Rodentolepis nana]
MLIEVDLIGGEAGFGVFAGGDELEFEIFGDGGSFAAWFSFFEGSKLIRY